MFLLNISLWFIKLIIFLDICHILHLRINIWDAWYNIIYSSSHKYIHYWILSFWSTVIWELIHFINNVSILIYFYMFKIIWKRTLSKSERRKRTFYFTVNWMTHKFNIQNWKNKVKIKNQQRHILNFAAISRIK